MSRLDDPAASSMQVMEEHMIALNAHDEERLARTLHFPHYRLANGKLTTWSGPESYFRDFRARAGTGWHASAWLRRDVVAASSDKVHVDAEFIRKRADGSELSRFRSLWIVANIGGNWAVQLRSTFAP